MKFDLTKTFKTRAGLVIQMELADQTKRPMTAKDAFLQSMDHVKNLEEMGEEKYKRYLLSKKMEKSTVDFTEEEISSLKKWTGEFPFTPQLLGQLWDFLDQKEEAKLKVV